MKNLKALSFFTGAMGLDIGLKKAGIEIVLACESEKFIRETIKLNNPKLKVLKDINLYSAKDIRKEAGLKKNEKIDLIVGGPPCQGNSNLNNHTRGTDERNLLYLRMARMIEILKPEYAIIENVAGVRRAQQKVVSETKNWLETVGYSTVEGLINGRNVGVPQMRKRHFSIASRVSTHNLSSFQHREGIEERPISWAIEDLLEVYDENDVLNSASKAKEENQARMDYLIENDLYNLPSEHRPKCHQKYDVHGPRGNTYPAVYGRMYWDRPAPTITTGYSCNGRGRFTHPKLARCLTVREAARVQSFPDFFDFRNQKRTNLNKMLGNAVPPLMAKHIATILFEEP